MIVIPVLFPSIFLTISSFFLHFSPQQQLSVPLLKTRQSSTEQETSLWRWEIVQASGGQRWRLIDTSGRGRAACCTGGRRPRAAEALSEERMGWAPDACGMLLVQLMGRGRGSVVPPRLIPPPHLLQAPHIPSVRH